MIRDMAAVRQQAATAMKSRVMVGLPVKLFILRRRQGTVKENVASSCKRFCPGSSNSFLQQSLSREKTRLQFDFSLLLGYIDLLFTSVMRSAMRTFLDYSMRS
jgi:hypothetical protein